MDLHWNHERWLRQPALTPHFETMRAWFDLERVARVLAPMCPASDPLRHVTLARVSYRPPQRLRLVYALHTVAGACRHATVDLRGEGPEPAPSASAHRVGLDTSTAGFAWLLPDDPADLPLAMLMAPGFTEHQLGMGVQPDSAGLLSYRPGRRLAQRWMLAGDGAAAVVLKHHPGAVAAHARLQRLQAQTGRGFAIPRPLACHPGHAVRWESFVAGERLATAAQKVGWTPLIQRTMAALAALHDSASVSASGQAAAAPVHTRAMLLDRLGGKVMRRVQAAVPARAEAVASRIEALLRWQAPSTPAHASLHGDLRTDKLLLSPTGEIMMLDLGGMVRGEATLDLARLGSELVLQSLLGQLEPRTAWATATGLPAAYRQALRQRPGPYADAILALPAHAFEEAYAWYLTALLLSLQLETCVRHAAPALDSLCVEFVRLAGGMLADRGAAMVGHTRDRIAPPGVSEIRRRTRRRQWIA